MESQTLNIEEINLQWSQWFSWNLLIEDSRGDKGIKIPNGKSGVYEVKFLNDDCRLTIGKASNLRHRIRQCLVKGISSHSAGKRIRQLEDVSNIIVRWAETNRPNAVEEELHMLYRKKYDCLPKYVERT